MSENDLIDFEIPEIVQTVEKPPVWTVTYSQNFMRLNADASVKPIIVTITEDSELRVSQFDGPEISANGIARRQFKEHALKQVQIYKSRRRT